MMLTTQSLNNAALAGSGCMLLPSSDRQAEGAISVELLERWHNLEWVRAELDSIEEEHNRGIIRECPQGRSGNGLQINPANNHPNSTGKDSPYRSQAVAEAVQELEPVVFISHATPNLKMAEEVCQWIEPEGLPLWIAPRNPEPGCSYNEAISKALFASRVMVLILSADSVKSDHVRREVRFAIEEKKIVIPFRIEAVEMPVELRYLLAGIQFIDATNGSPSQHRESLVNAIWKRLSELSVPERSSC